MFYQINTISTPFFHWDCFGTYRGEKFNLATLRPPDRRAGEERM
jgi:hypothetical protein